MTASQVPSRIKRSPLKNYKLVLKEDKPRRVKYPVAINKMLTPFFFS